MAIDLKEHKCPNCNASVTFDPGRQMMKCPYCDSEFATDIFDTPLEKSDMSWQNESTDEFSEQDGMRVYTCNSCGGEIITDLTTAADICPYCDSTVVMKGNLSGVLKPDYIIPFKLDKKTAVEKFKSHLLNKKLLPKVFKNEVHIEEIKGVYVPFWLFDATADASAKFKATRVRSWSTPNHIYTETSHYSLLRAGSISFSRVPVDGSTKMADDLMESLEPYDHSQAVAFNTAYLSGYLADKYDVTKDECKTRANDRIKQSAVDRLRETVHGYSSVTNTDCSVQFKKSAVHYALYPVWILNTTWKNERYVFAMNGQTGKFVGNLPCDMGAFWRWLLGVFGVAFVIFGAISLLFW